MPGNVDMRDDKYGSCGRRRLGAARNTGVRALVGRTYAQGRQLLVKLRDVRQPAVVLPRGIVTPFFDNDEVSGTAVLLEHIRA